MSETPIQERTTAEKLQSIPKWMLYLCLVIACTIPLLIPNFPIPKNPGAETKDLYEAVKAIPEGSTVLVASDWTNSTRGESRGSFEALIRTLIRRKVKFAIFTSADPQAPEVSRNAVKEIIAEEEKAGYSCKHWTDWVSLGYFPGAEGTAKSMGANLVRAFGSKKDLDDTNPQNVVERAVFESPVLKNIKKIEDVPLLVIITASKTSTIAIERLYGKVPLGLMVTGVMGPETLVYYASKQIVGMSAGLKGVYDMESQMADEFGSNEKAINYNRGKKYLPSLHFAIGLLIIAVIIGNLGMFLSRREK